MNPEDITTNIETPKAEDLPKHNQIRLHLEEIAYEKGRLVEALESLQVTLREIQEGCAHENIECKYEKQWCKDKLLSKSCLDCKKRFKRPRGSSSEVCDRCWGEMKWQGIIPGQGGRTHVYECTKCGHTHEQT